MKIDELNEKIEVMEQTIEELQEENRKLRCEIDKSKRYVNDMRNNATEIEEKANHWKIRCDELEAAGAKADAAYQDLCRKCNMYENATATLSELLQNILKGI